MCIAIKSGASTVVNAVLLFHPGYAFLQIVRFIWAKDVPTDQPRKPKLSGQPCGQSHKVGRPLTNNEYKNDLIDDTTNTNESCQHSQQSCKVYIETIKVH